MLTVSKQENLALFGGRSMKALLLPAQTVDFNGERLTRALWPVLTHGPPPDILTIALEIEDWPLAISVARHWGCLIQRRTSQGLLLLELNSVALAPEIARALASQQAVIVVRSLNANNLTIVKLAKAKLEKLSGKKVEVGALTDELGTHDGLVVRTPDEIKNSEFA